MLKRKLLFIHHLINVEEDSLAHQCALVQDKLSLPGLISEMKEAIKELDLPNMKNVPRNQWKSLVNKKMKEKYRNDLVKLSERYKKINTEEIAKDTFGRKPYMANLRMNQARTKFKIVTKMTKNIKLNYKNDPKNVRNLWKCSECDHIDSQEHILWCEGYEKLRENKNLDSDHDLTSYFQQVMLQRERKEK